MPCNRDALQVGMSAPGEYFLYPVAVFVSSPSQAFLGFERGQRCFPEPVVASDGGKTRIPFEPKKGAELDKCIDENGKQKLGLTYEGELNKVIINGNVNQQICA